jgi:hypothetical protein
VFDVSLRRVRPFRGNARGGGAVWQSCILSGALLVVRTSTTRRCFANGFKPARLPRASCRNAIRNETIFNTCMSRVFVTDCYFTAPTGSEPDRLAATGCSHLRVQERDNG